MNVSTVWTLADEEALKEAMHVHEAYKARQRASTERTLTKLKAYVDKSVPHHSISLDQISAYLLNNRWALVEILTEGEYSTMIAQRELARKSRKANKIK
jgi:hypothetical protein